MATYKARVSVSISEDLDSYGNPLAGHSYLTYSRDFTFTGEKFADIAPQIDRILDAMERDVDD